MAPVPLSVHIRPFRSEDIPPLYEAVLQSRQELAPWMPWLHPDYSLDDTRLFVEARMLAFSSGADYAFAIHDDGGGLLGTCGLNQLDALNRHGNLGYWVRTSHLGRGVATAAARALADWAFLNTPLIRLDILASVENRASQRVAEKLGAAKEGVLRQRILLGGRAHDAVLYALLKSEALPHRQVCTD